MKSLLREPTNIHNDVQNGLVADCRISRLINSNLSKASIPVKHMEQMLVVGSIINFLGYLPLYHQQMGSFVRWIVVVVVNRVQSDRSVNWRTYPLKLVMAVTNLHCGSM